MSLFTVKLFQKFNKLTLISFSCIYSVTDHEFCPNIVKVAVYPQGIIAHAVSGSVDYFEIIIGNSLSITGQTPEKLTSICFYDNKLPNCPLALNPLHK